MSKHAEVFMSNGSSYQLTVTPEEVYKKITHSDGKPLDHIHQFETAKGESVFLHSSHIVSIVEYTSLTDSHHSDSDADKKEKKEENLEAAQKFKEELGDNME